LIEEGDVGGVGGVAKAVQIPPLLLLPRENEPADVDLRRQIVKVGF
jgi:hypothetical protein